MGISGQSLIAGRHLRGSGTGFWVTAPATMTKIEPEFGTLDASEAAEAAEEATAAYNDYRNTSPVQRAEFLNTIADNLEALRNEIVQRATVETGLPATRIEGELSRTTNQLRLFGQEVLRGDHQGVRISPAQPNRQPTPAPEIRQRQIAIGPVLVFGASNFPLAFSVAGGDTASALAAGCPVVVKAHSSHAGTAELAGLAITDAVRACSLPLGTFSMVFGPGPVVGQVLAKHPGIKAIAFTGSQAAGTDLMRIAAERPEPIPVYAEMSSINPVLWLPAAAESDVEERAREFAASLTLGAGQFCTNPGLLFLPASASKAHEAVRSVMSESRGQTMLSDKIADSYLAGVERLRSIGIQDFAVGALGGTLNAPAPTVFECDATSFLGNPNLQEEVFGSAAIVVDYNSIDELQECAEALQGQLTVTLHFTDEDLPEVAALIPTLETKAGRLIANGWPTGVEVNSAMVHGGPFPATSDPRTTSVGTLAIWRFQRPVAYQNFPNAVLPAPTRDSNPLGLPQRNDGVE